LDSASGVLWKSNIPPANFRIVYDESKCWWCRSCELVCSLKHEGKCSPSLSRIRISLDLFQAKAEAGVCRQCISPECFFACPVPGAMKVHPETGARLIDRVLCIGCGACTRACPFNEEGTIIGHKSRSTMEEGKAPWVYFRCDLCDGHPACVETCPTGALQLQKLKSRGD